MIIRINEENEELFCCDSKERIEIGEKYAELVEVCYGEIVVKSYKLENLPLMNAEEDDVYIISEDEEIG